MTETHSLAFLAANNFGDSCICDDCKKEYYVEIHCLTRADELRNEADDVGQGMASPTEDDDEIHGDLKSGACHRATTPTLNAPLAAYPAPR